MSVEKDRDITNGLASECLMGQAEPPFPFQDNSVNRKPTNPKDIVGIKKAALSCVPLPVIIEIGLGMMEGALKYGRHNYRAVGVRASVYFDATIRHLFAWWEGEDTDPDSALSHVTKAITSLVVLRDAMMRGKMEDDRAPATPNMYMQANKHAEALIAKYATAKPQHYTIKDQL